MLILDGDVVRAALPMPAAIDVMRDSMRAYAEGKVYQPPRVVLQPPQLSGYTFLKSAVVAAEEIAFGLKVITFFPDNPSKRGLPAISGFIALFDPSNGALIALLDGGVATEIRTGAVSGVATDALSRPDAGDLALIGAGAQARSHLAAMAAVRTLRRVRVWNHTESGAKSFAAWAADTGLTSRCPPRSGKPSGARIWSARSPRPASRSWMASGWPRVPTSMPWALSSRRPASCTRMSSPERGSSLTAGRARHKQPETSSFPSRRVPFRPMSTIPRSARSWRAHARTAGGRRRHHRIRVARTGAAGRRGRGACRPGGARTTPRRRGSLLEKVEAHDQRPAIRPPACPLRQRRSAGRARRCPGRRTPSGRRAGSRRTRRCPPASRPRACRSPRRDRVGRH